MSPQQTNDLSELLSVYLNDELLLQYDRKKRIPGHQRLFLDKMDADMDAGISMAGEFIANPNAQERLHYVAIKLVRGLLAKEQALVASTSTYLSSRYVSLKEIQAHESGEQVGLDFVFD